MVSWNQTELLVYKVMTLYMHFQIGLFLSAVLPDESTVILACVATLMICLNICGKFKGINL